MCIRDRIQHTKLVYQIFPFDATRTIDLDKMVIYDTLNPENWNYIYRTKYNAHTKPKADERTKKIKKNKSSLPLLKQYHEKGLKFGKDGELF